MESSRFINLLRLLSHSQFRRFVSFVESPYHNQNEKLIKLIRHLAKASPDFRGPLLDKEVIFSATFGREESFEPQKVFNQMSRLRQLWEKFVIVEQIGQDNKAQELHLLQGLDQWQLNDAISKSFDRVWEVNEKQIIRDNSYFLHAHQLLAFAELGNRNERRGMNAVLLQRMEALDLFYLTTRLKYSAEWLNRKFISNLSGEDYFIELLIKELAHEEHPYRKVPAVSIYFQILKTFYEPDNENHFHNLLSLIADNAELFEKKELGDMYNYAQNYCVRKINQGRGEYFKEVFEIYKRQLEGQALITGGFLPHEHYKNITTVGLRLKQYDWVKTFLAQYQPQLHPEVRENAYIYNLSVYYYEQQRYPEAMRALQKVSFTDVYYDLSARQMLLKIYYETKDWDSLRYHLEAYRAFLKRNKSISKVKLQQNQELIRQSKKLMRLRKSRGAADPQTYQVRWEALKEGLAVANSVHKSWLLKQCELLTLNHYSLG
ncbi:MAG: hypothetical protein AAF927_32175 [Bacteroidota bacterium]